MCSYRLTYRSGMVAHCLGNGMYLGSQLRPKRLKGRGASISTFLGRAWKTATKFCFLIKLGEKKIFTGSSCSACKEGFRLLTMYSDALNNFSAHVSHRLKS